MFGRKRRLRRAAALILAAAAGLSLTMCAAEPLISKEKAEKAAESMKESVKESAKELIKEGLDEALGSLTANGNQDEEAKKPEDGAETKDGADVPPEGSDGDGKGDRVFLITGIDRVGNNSDVIILARLDGGNGSLSAVQIPRDSYINDPGYPFHKINSVYAYGYNVERSKGGSISASVKAGNRELAGFLERVLPVRIDRYISVGTDGFVDIINSVGGVDVDIPFDLSYDDSKQDLHIHFDAGVNRLDGLAAEKFVRYRSGYVNADYGRMDAQKLLIFSLLSKIRHDLTLPQAISLIANLYTKVTTDMPATELLGLVPALFKLAPAKIEMITLKGRSVTVSGTMYEAHNKAHTLDIVNKFLLTDPAGVDSLDPSGLLTNEDNEKIYAYYTDTAPFGAAGYNGEQTDKIGRSIPKRSTAGEKP